MKRVVFLSLLLVALPAIAFAQAPEPPLPSPDTLGGAVSASFNALSAQASQALDAYRRVSAENHALKQRQEELLKLCGDKCKPPDPKAPAK